jgi:hypothetical protein
LASGKRKSRRAASGRASDLRAIVAPDAKPSAYAREAVAAFREGVQKEYARLAKLGVATVVVRDGQLVTGIPHKVRGRFVVGDSDPRPSAKG